MRFRIKKNSYAGGNAWTEILSMIFLLAVCLATSVSAQTEKSVVRIKINGIDKGTGFIFNTSNQVVTALHVVAGQNTISVYSEATDEESPARIEKVHMESDLALLKLEKNLGISDLKQNLTPNLKAEHTIWGYPRDVATMQGDPIRFSKSMHKSPTLTSILKVGDTVMTGLKVQGYPSPNVNILRVGSNIQPGHSGAPIVDDRGFIVGIADGGLYNGTARINWAISASYLSTLLNKGITKSHHDFPSEPSLQTALFSAGTSGESVQVAFGTNESLQKVMTIALSEVYNNLVPEDQEYMDIWLNAAKEVDGQDLLLSPVDVYENFKTGATIVVPAGISILYDARGGLLEARSDSGNIVMHIQIMENDAWHEGVAAKQKFTIKVKDWVDETGIPIEWEENPDLPNEPPVHDEEIAFFSQRLTWIGRSTDTGVESDLFVDLIIDDANFLGVAVRARGTFELNGSELLIYNLMTACTLLASFPIN